MNSGKPKLSYVVKFAPTEADQALLRTVEQVLEAQSYKNFSDLCKQALRLLLSTESAATVASPMLAILEQQLMTLQLQVMQLERRDSNFAVNIEQQLQQLHDRITQLEQPAQLPLNPADANHADTQPTASPPSPMPEPDPLLSRLAPLLEDF